MIIDQLGKASVAVYIISAHPVLLTFLWTDILRLVGVIERSIFLYLGIMFISDVVIFIICVIIDKVIGKVSSLLRMDQMALKIDRLRLWDI